MQELIPIKKSKGGRDVVSARDLYQFLGVVSNFTTWFARRTEDYGFTEKIDFVPILEESSGGRQAQNFVITLDMAKELSMVERNEKGKEARRYFIACEKKLREAIQQPQIPQDLPGALRLAADLAEQKQALQAQLTLAAPKVAFYEAVAVAQNTVCMARVAQVLKIPGMGRNNLFRRLKADHILQKNNAPYQRYIEQGFFEVEAQPYIAGKDGEKGPRLGVTTRVTTKGLQWLSGRYKTAA